MRTRSQQPRRGMTMVASRFRSALPLGSSKNGWDNDTEGMRAVGTRPATAFCRVPKGTPAAPTIGLPAIDMAGYHCQMPTASALRNLRNLN